MLFLFSLAFVSANINVRYTVYEAELNDTNDLIETSNIVSGFNVDVYTCANLNCSLKGAEVTSLSTSTSVDNVVISYPTVRLSDYGYALYFYDEDYIGYQVWGEKAQGDSTDTFDAPNVYLAKKTNRWLPIKSFDGVSNTLIGNILKFNTTVGFSSADLFLPDTRHVDIDLKENISGLVTFSVIDTSDLSVVYTQVKNIVLDYDAETDLDFDYNFSSIGIYNVWITTEIDDLKIINKNLEKDVVQVKVVETTNNNYSFSELNIDRISDNTPQVNEEIEIDYSYKSRYVDEFGIKQKSNSTIVIRIDDSSNNEIYNFTASFNDTGKNKFVYTFNDAENYLIKMSICPERIDGNYSLCYEENITISVWEIYDGDDDDDDSSTSSNSEIKIDISKKSTKDIVSDFVVSTSNSYSGIDKSENFYQELENNWPVVLTFTVGNLLLIGLIAFYFLKPF